MDVSQVFEDATLDSAPRTSLSFSAPAGLVRQFKGQCDLRGLKTSDVLPKMLRAFVEDENNRLKLVGQ